MSRLALPLSLLFLLSGCGGDAPPPEAPGGAAVAAPDAGTAPDGSAGAFTLRFAESDDEGAPATEVEGFFGPPVPADALEMTPLDGVPSYHIGADTATVPDGFELNGTYFVFIQQPADGPAKVSLLRGHVGLSNNFQDPYVGQAAAFTFPPLWPASGPAPTLTLDRMGDESGQVATMPLAVMGERPAWAQPVEVPPGVDGARPVVTAEVEMGAEGLAPYLLYRESGDGNRWGLEDFRESRSEIRRREREGDTRPTTPYSVYPDDMSQTDPEAYLVVFAM